MCIFVLFQTSHCIIIPVTYIEMYHQTYVNRVKMCISTIYPAMKLCDTPVGRSSGEIINKSSSFPLHAFSRKNDRSFALSKIPRLHPKHPVSLGDRFVCLYIVDLRDFLNAYTNKLYFTPCILDIHGGFFYLSFFCSSGKQNSASDKKKKNNAFVSHVLYPF